jgi:ABC-type microcin C transport system permease subunit YejE
MSITVATEENPWARGWRRLRRRKGAMAALFVVIFLIAVAVLAPWIAPYDPTQTSFGQVRKPPSWLHWFGTDEVGRDVPRSVPVSCPWASPWAPECRSACWRAMPAAGSTPCCRAWSTRCWQYRS